MSLKPQNHPEAETENRRLRQTNAEARKLLAAAAGQLRSVLQEEVFIADTAIEVTTAMESALETITHARRCLESAAAKAPAAAPVPGGPTRQQGQFLAFIREYMMRNQSGVAPSHADFQRYFNLTPPSVNSMLIRLEQRGFIRRIPHTARAIELTINPDWIPPLERPFRF